MKKLTANIIGATGLVGSHLVRLLLDDDRFQTIKVFSRRKTGISHPKLEEHLVDFDQIANWSNQLTGDILFSTLGTTLKKAGTLKKQFLVDYTYQYSVAEAASENGIPIYVLVSSVGANAHSRVFYSKMKGELEHDVRRLDFEETIILRPSILDGKREEKRGAERIGLKVSRALTKVFFKKYRPIHGKTVAKAMVNSVFAEHQTPTYSIYQLDQLFKLATK